MPQPPQAIDISSMPDVSRLAHEVARTGESRVLRENGTDLAVVSPARPHRRGRKALTPEQREAVLATAGGWVGLVDAEQLKRELKEARGDHRPPVEL